MKSKMLSLRRYAAPAAAVAALTFAGAVNAAPVDVADVVTDIGAQVSPITAIGGAVLLVAVAVAAFRWVRSALR